MKDDPRFAYNYDKHIQRKKQMLQDARRRNCLRLFIWSAVLVVFCVVVWNMGSGGTQ